MSHPASGFELREHTADVALYAWGDTLEALFRSSADGLYAVLGELHTSGGGEPTAITVTDGDLADLLGDFLAELLYLFDSARVRMADIEFAELRDGRVRAAGLAEPLDLRQSSFDCEVKAVTRHNLAIVKTANGYETTVILDL